MQPSNEVFLTDESCSTLQLWTKLQAHQRAQFDHSQQQYTMELVNLLENICFKWQHSTQENSKLSEQNASLKRQLSNYEQALSESRETNLRLNSNLAAARSHIEALEIELNEYRKRFDAAKEEIQNISIVHLPKRRSNSLPPARRTRQKNGILSGNKRFIDVEEEDEELDTQSEENSIPTPPKQKKLDLRINSQSKFVVPVLVQQQQSSSKTQNARGSQKRTVNRSISESRIFDDKKEADQKQLPPIMSAICTTSSTLDMRVRPMMGFGTGWTRGRPVEQCAHNFVSSSNLFSVAFFCNICTRSLGLRSLKCNDCKLQIHENCRQHSPMPCVPMIQTPQKNNPKQRPRLADLCPETQPKIPGQLIRSVVALERGFLSTVGLYRVPGCDSEVKRLKENFNSKYVPKLDQMDPETITGFIKKFLRDLREPLIPLSSFKEFYSAVMNKDEAKLKYAIETLPIPNCDTLAFLCAHWQKVAMRSNENQMPLENLAKVLGPTVVGTSSKLTHLQQPATGTIGAAGADQHTLHYMEANKQVEILYTLLKLDHNYWTNFYNNQQQVNEEQRDLTPRRGILHR